MTETPNLNSLLSRRISRRLALRGTAIIGASGIAVAVVGCRGSSQPSARSTPAPARGGTLRAATSVPVSYGLDPHIERGTALAIFPRVYGYSHHVDFQHDDALILDHAESIEQPDATTIVLRLRGDVRFQDVAPISGRAVRADDVAASILRYRDHPLVVEKLWHASVLDRIDMPDDRTVRVVTRRPYVYSLEQLGAIGAGAIIPRELVDAGTDLRTAGCGSGPFAIESADADAQSWRIVRNEAYFGAPLPYVDSMEWRVYDSDDAKLTAFLANEADQVDNRDRAESIAAAGGGHSRVVIDGHPSLAWLSLGLRTDRPPFVDPRVREALGLAIDRDALIRAIAPDAGTVLGPVNPHLSDGYWSLPEDDIRNASGAVTAESERRANAMKLLDVAGGTGASFAIQTVNTPRMIDLATAVRDQLSRVGLDVRIEELDELTWFANFRRGAFESTLITHPPYETPDLPLRLYHSGGVDGTMNPFGLADAALDALIERSWKEFDRTERRRTLLDAQHQALATHAMLQLFASTGYVSTWDPVRGRGQELLGSLAQYNYRQWLA